MQAASATERLVEPLVFLLCLAFSLLKSHGLMQASSAVGAWMLHLVILKVLLFLLSIPGGIPTLEVACYAGYAFVPVCLSMLASVLAGMFCTLWIGPPHSVFCP